MHHNDDNSLSSHSVFDWGSGPTIMRSAAPSSGSARPDASVNSNNSGSGDAGTLESGVASRYDPKAMSRIVDITDLVDESSDNEDSDDDIHIGGSNGKIGGASGAVGAMSIKTKTGSSKNGMKYGPGGNMLLCKQVLILLALVGIIIGASMSIGLAVLSSDGPSNITANSPAASGGDQQRLLETAERIVKACATKALDNDLSECQKLCKKNMCCFETGKYNCENDESKACAAYAGCEALVEGISVGGAGEEQN